MKKVGVPFDYIGQVHKKLMKGCLSLDCVTTVDVNDDFVDNPHNQED